MASDDPSGLVSDVEGEEAMRELAIGAMPPLPVPPGPPPVHPAPEPARPQRKYRRLHSFLFSHTDNANAKAPRDFTREEFGLLLRKRHVEAFQTDGAQSVARNSVLKVFVAKELHSDGKEHMYAIVLADHPYGAEQVRRSLGAKDKVFLSFGTNHAYFWTALVYCSVPSVHKSKEEIDTDPWHSLGLTVREELMDFPKGARAAEKDRVRNFLGIPQPGQQRSTKPDAYDKTSFAEVVVEEGWRNNEDVFAAARALKPENPKLWNTVVAWKSKDLREFLEHVWAVQGIPDAPPTDRVEKLLSVSKTAACICNGAWIPAVERLIAFQELDSMQFRSLVLRALRLGRHKGINVLILGAPDGGKSFAFRPLARIFETFITSGQNESFPLQDLFGAEVCVLQDVRYESFGLPWDDWLRWGEGEDVKVKLPRNHFVASKKYTGTAPLFATMATLFCYPMCEAKRTGRSIEYENCQMRSRWCQVVFRHSIPEAERQPALPACACCAARWYAAAIAGSASLAGDEHNPWPDLSQCTQEGPAATESTQRQTQVRAHRSTQPPSLFAASSHNPWPQLSQCTQVAVDAAASARSPSLFAAGSQNPWPQLSQCTQVADEGAASEPEPKRLRADQSVGAPSREDVLWSRLSQLVAWKQAGLLSDGEFVVAKGQLGLNDAGRS